MSGIAKEKQEVKSDQDRTAEKKQALPLEASSNLTEEAENTRDENYRQGVCYYTGSGGYTCDVLKGIAYLRKAAAQGHPKAQNYLGVLYDEGRVIDEELSQTQCHAKATKLFQKAAAQGYVYAQFNLGRMYHYNLGVASEQLDDTKRCTQAAKYYCLADRQGHKDAKASLTQLERDCDHYSWFTTLKIWGWTGVWRRFSVPSDTAIEASYNMLQRNPSQALEEAVRDHLADPRSTYLAPCIPIEEEKSITPFSSPISSEAQSSKQRSNTYPSSSIEKPPSKSPTLD